jgi:hypothetical protein
MVFTFLAEKSLTNFLASFPNFPPMFLLAASSSSCLHLNGSQFIPGFLFNLLISLSYKRSILNVFCRCRHAAFEIRWFGFYLISFKLFRWTFYTTGDLFSLSCYVVRVLRLAESFDNWWRNLYPDLFSFLKTPQCYSIFRIKSHYSSNLDWSSK